MALEPAGLEGDGTAGCRPICSVGGSWHAAARVHPLHAIGEGVVGDQIVTSPAWIGYDGMRGCESRKCEREKCSWQHRVGLCVIAGSGKGTRGGDRVEISYLSKQQAVDSPPSVSSSQIALNAGWPPSRAGIDPASAVSRRSMFPSVREGPLF
jgi:hypothetical protein